MALQQPDVIKITPAMIDAGRMAVRDNEIDFYDTTRPNDMEEMLEAVFVAMILASRKGGRS